MPVTSETLEPAVNRPVYQIERAVQDLCPKQFHGAFRCGSDHSQRRIRGSHRLVGLREIDTSEDHGRADAADVGPRRSGGTPVMGPRRDIGMMFQQATLSALENHARKHPAADRDARRQSRRRTGGRTGAAIAETRGSGPSGGCLSQRAVRRHGTARRDLPDADHRSCRSASGRAVFGAGRADARFHEHGIAAHLRWNATPRPFSSPIRSPRR